MSENLATYRGVDSSLSTDLSVLLRRRVLLGALVVATTLVFAVWLYHVIAAGGFGLLEICLVFFFLVHITWLTLDFWNAIVGFYLLRISKNILARVSPPLANTQDASAFPERIAVVMTIRNEDANGVFARLDAIKTSLSNTPFEAQCGPRHALERRQHTRRASEDLPTPELPISTGSRA